MSFVVLYIAQHAPVARKLLRSLCLICRMLQPSQRVHIQPGAEATTAVLCNVGQGSVVRFAGAGCQLELDEGSNLCLVP